MEDAAAGLSAPISVCLDQLDEEACVRRVRLLVCPRLLPAPVFSVSVLFDKKVSRGLLRRRGQGARSPTPGQLRPGQGAHVGKLQHPSPSPAAREAGSLSLSLSLSLKVEPQLLSFSSHVAEQTGNKNKNEPNKSFLCCRTLSTTVPGCDFSENDRRNFAQIPFRSTV